MLKSSCTDLFSAMLRCEALHAGLDAARVDELCRTFGPAERKQLLTWLPEGARLALQALEKSLAAKTGTVDGFFEAMWAAEAGAGGGQCQRLDKKREKSLLADARASMREQLQLEAQPAVCIHLAVLLLQVELNGVLLDAPGRLVPLLLEQLQPKLAPAAHAELARFQGLVQASLAGSARGEAAASADADGELRAAVDSVREIGLSKGHARAEAAPAAGGGAE